MPIQEKGNFGGNNPWERIPGINRIFESNDSKITKTENRIRNLILENGFTISQSLPDANLNHHELILTSDGRKFRAVLEINEYQNGEKTVETRISEFYSYEGKIRAIEISSSTSDDRTTRSFTYENQDSDGKELKLPVSEALKFLKDISKATVDKTGTESAYRSSLEEVETQKMEGKEITIVWPSQNS